ncbi:hypothetical protein BJ170DRAFT_456668 [Xylariales sp. AK1849]|nr:hypothetical protein BJ170DRAFT_456668 [Xylariales sp. AK1849]
MSIKKAHAKTCQWLLKTHQYLDWLDTKKLDNHYGFLWIKGKPGAGKSTLMKFAVSHARRTLKQKIVISFFFNARGDDLEKSTVGLYRSLLLQLLEARPALQFVLDSVRMGHQWSVESLKSLFEEAIRALGEDSLVCFIDALDECKESQIRDMVSSLSELAVSVGARVHICFASRHYPHITVQEALGLVLEDQQEHDQDIASYLGSALRIGHDPTAEKIRSELQNKASGVFMWVVLVVDILNKEYDRGRKHTLVDRLRHIPNDLHELFRDILTRDHNNTHGLLLCIQWVLCARQPLTPEQLYFAVISENEPDSLPRCHSDDISRDDILKYILDNSKGLAESTKSKTPTVQFIHESVNDFLLKDNGLKAIWPDLGSNYQGQIHEKLKQCCVKYMSAEPVTHLDLPSPLPKASSKQATALRQSVAEKCPFLEYAHQNILYHADEAESKGVSQKDFLRDFTITDWVRYHNVFEKHQVRRYPPNVRLVYILAESNMSALIRAQPSRQSCFNIGGERYGTPIFAALATESEEAVRTLLEIEAENQLAESLLNGLSRQYAEDGTKVYKFSRDFTFSPQRNVLSHIAELGNEKILGFFLAIREVDIDLIDVSGRTPLSRAAERGNEATVRLLLEKEAQIEARDKYGRTPLSWAAERGNEATVRLLLGKGAQIEAQDDEGWTPLIRAAGKQRNEATVRLLLEKGAQIEAQDISGRTPLLWAQIEGTKLPCGCCSRREPRGDSTIQGCLGCLKNKGLGVCIKKAALEAVYTRRTKRVGRQ